MKIIKALCVIIGFVGFMLLLGAFGGLEKDLCTQAEFWRMVGISSAMVLTSLMACVGNENNE